MMRILFYTVIFCFSGVFSHAQPADVIQEYVNTYRAMAIAEMQRTGVPASITLAQGIHETEAGRSELVLKSNNHFGIKCKSVWTGAKVYHDDDARGECFRSYTDPYQSYQDHSDFLRNGSRYAFLFQLQPTDYKGWAHGLRKAGYATNPKYSQILIRLIETYDLQHYTLIALGRETADFDLALKAPQGSSEAVAENNAEKVIAPIFPAYPAGRFEINETPVVFVKGGTSLLAVANQNGLTLSRLLEFNDMTPGEGDILADDQLVFLQRKRKTGVNAQHIVVPEETMYDIAQSEGVRYESILELNLLNAGQEPMPGEVINLREKSTKAPRLATSSPVVTSQPAVTKRHVVQTKETLFSIGRKYGVSADQIREWNRLTSNSLHSGQELIIYTN
ncbi:glucosaminidase domain-containing protein [Flavihumibacter petaseus]|uniref:Peptidoglycan hydrolase n=1 Tax=Flavihumibacter petaseus NBRC 106054 TaxID=1220578 RepID=A0A0E9MV55_9BACT|nr:glucosaminidase domain-containing protein [Flavihumibacter petaseus]GAO41321.1 putative lysozyme [Flavihumibacter petaseus NBRC 106054]